MALHVTEPFATGEDFFKAASIDENDTVAFTVDIPLYALIEGDIETMNDMVEGLAFSAEGVLSDIDYRVSDEPAVLPNCVRVQVTCGVVFF